MDAKGSLASQSSQIVRLQLQRETLCPKGKCGLWREHNMDSVFMCVYTHAYETETDRDQTNSFLKQLIKGKLVEDK